MLLTTIGPKGSGVPGLQLALYYLKAYFVKYSRKQNLASIDTLTFPFNENTKTIISRIKEKKPHIISFSCYVWNILKTLEVAKIIKKTTPGVKIVFGGSEVSPRACRLMNAHSFIDAIVIGEGERAFKELLERWLSGKTDISDIKGIACRKNGKTVLTGIREPMANLDEVPSPYLEKIIDDKAMKSAGTIPTETMRGCPYRCYFCYYHKDFGKVDYFSLERVEKELKFLLSKTPRHIYFMDPTFNVNKERAKKILRIFIKYNKKTTLHVELKAEFLDREMIDLLYKAKTNFIEIGIQSTNKKTLKLINRHLEPDKFRENILLLNKRGLPYEIQLIDGLPGDNYKTLEKAIDWLFPLKPRLIKIMRFMLLPGTYLRDNAARLGIKYGRRAPYHSIESDTFSREDLKKTTKLRQAMYAVYDSALLRKTLYPLTRKLGIEFSEVLGEWNRWAPEAGRPRRRRLQKVKKEDKIEKALRRLRGVKEADRGADFIKHICEKYKKPRIATALLASARKDAKAFLKKRGITKHSL